MPQNVAPVLRLAAFSAVALIATAPPAEAAGSLSDGAVTLTYPAAHWTETQAASLVGAESSTAASSITQTGWWWRVGSTRENALPAPDVESYLTGVATWNDLAGLGLRVHKEFGVADNEGPSGTYHCRVRVTNEGTTPRTLAFFHYLDAAAGGTAGNDAGLLAGGNLVQFTDGANVVRYSAAAPDAYQAGTAAALKARLSDADLDDLDGSGLPFAPGDMAAAFQWNATLQPGGVADFEIVVSVRTPVHLVKGDLGNRWNYSDILLSRRANNQVYVLDMLRSFRENSLAGGGFGSRAAQGSDDFTGDSRSDIVYRDTVTGQIVFGDPYVPTIPLSGGPILTPNWILAATADFTHDGQPDLLWRNVTSQRLAIWTMNGTVKVGNVVPSPDHAVDANWQVVAAADMNVDGNTDLVWYNVTSGRCVIWYMDASVVRTLGSFTTPPAAADAGWRVVGVGEWGQGPGSERPAVAHTPDLLWRNLSSGSLVVWHLNRNGERSAGVFVSGLGAPFPPADWDVVGPR